MAAEMPDDHTARSHKREREAYAQQMKPEAEDEDIDENEAQDDRPNLVPNTSFIAELPPAAT